MMAILITGNASGGHTNPAGTVCINNNIKNDNLSDSSRRLDYNNYMCTERNNCKISPCCYLSHIASMFLLFFHSQFLLQY